MMTMREIIHQVSLEYGVSVEDLLSDRRFKKLVIPRQDAVWRMRREYKDDGRHRYSFTQIANLFNRDHSTMVTGRQRHIERMEKRNAKRTSEDAVRNI